MPCLSDRGCCRLEEDVKVGAHGNVAEVLAAIARSRSSPLTRQLCDPSNLSILISKAVVPPPQTPSVQVHMSACDSIGAPTSEEIGPSQMLLVYSVWLDLQYVCSHAAFAAAIS